MTWLVGSTSAQQVLELWRYDGTERTRVVPSTLPPPRHNHALAFDALRGELVLFGGQVTPATRLADTWIFDGTDWTQRFPLNSPPLPLDEMPMVFDRALGRTVLFGEFANNPGPNPVAPTTWEWPARPRPGSSRRALPADSLCEPDSRRLPRAYRTPCW